MLLTNFTISQIYLFLFFIFVCGNQRYATNTALNSSFALPSSDCDIKCLSSETQACEDDLHVTIQLVELRVVQDDGYCFA